MIERLKAAGVTVSAPANPLRGISIDSAYTASVFEQAPGPAVAVGHSYGGAVITNSASLANNVVGLAYVAAFPTEEDERLGEATAASEDAILSSALVAWPLVDQRRDAHPKLEHAWRTDPTAVGLHLLALSYCAAYLTDWSSRITSFPRRPRRGAGDRTRGAW